MEGGGYERGYGRGRVRPQRCSLRVPPHPDSKLRTRAIAAEQARHRR